MDLVQYGRSDNFVRLAQKHESEISSRDTLVTLDDASPSLQYSGDPMWESRYNENVGPIDTDIKAVQV